MLYVTSDLHFGHTAILTLGKGRKFASIEEHDETLIAEHNKIVKFGDEVFNLGDFAMGATKKIADQYARRLNGHTYLIPGNHDSDAMLQLLKDKAPNFAQLDRTVLRRYKHIGEFFMSHCPHLSWPQCHSGAYHLHGHEHDDLKQVDVRRMDVGVDAAYRLLGAYRPFTIDEVVTFLRDKRYTPHHGQTKDI